MLTGGWVGFGYMPCDGFGSRSGVALKGTDGRVPGAGQQHGGAGAVFGLVGEQRVAARGRSLTVTEVTRKARFDDLRKVMRWALDNDETDRIGLSREFVRAFPSGGKPQHRRRSPFPDEVAHAVAAEANLRSLGMWSHTYKGRPGSTKQPGLLSHLPSQRIAERLAFFHPAAGKAEFPPGIGVSVR